MKFFKNAVHILFNKHLFVTNVVSSSVLMATGDAIEQKIDLGGKSECHKWQRTYNMLGVGFLLGPLQHVFYKCIDEKYPGRNLRSIMKKIVLDQTIASPIYIVAFFVCCGVLERRVKESSQEIRDKFFDIYMIDCCVWPPSQFLNFLFVSPKFRMLYVNCTTMVYDIFLTHFKHKDTNSSAGKLDRPT